MNRSITTPTLFKKLIDAVSNESELVDQDGHWAYKLSSGLNLERSYKTEAEVFSLSVTNLSFHVLFEMSQLQPLQTGICFMSILCK